MKSLKFLFLAGIIALFAVACNNDDDNNTDQPQNFPVVLTVDVDALLLLAAGSEASSVANFGQPAGVSNADYTTEARIGDMITFSLQSNLATDVFVIDSLNYASGDDLLSLEFVVPRGELGQPEYVLDVLDAYDAEDAEMKYVLGFSVIRNAVQSGYYFIDPKIRIRSRN
ncbi:MAG: hypothetical protein HKO72_03320 [Flavobacteriaceae bacterium]|nr:hypothetical protein [Bacteroidia bacterium]NNK29007.1 hypothetical protein [Flavobacteriaceae bacterium]NNL60350.1 hypothetical protein [Flavobacteriaceae bacterium]